MRILTVPGCGVATTVATLYAILLAVLLSTLVGSFDAALNSVTAIPRRCSAPPIQRRTTDPVWSAEPHETDTGGAVGSPHAVEVGSGRRLRRGTPQAVVSPGTVPVTGTGPSASERELLGALRLALIQSCVGVCIVATAGAIAVGLLLRRAATRLAVFLEVASDPEDRPAPVPPDEFRRLEIAVAAIPKSMARLRTNGRRATAMIAHDLRASVNGVRTAVESALVAEHGGNAAPDALPRALRRCDELADLLAALLRISEIEGAHAIRRADLDLAATAEFLFEAFEPAIVDSGRTLRLVTDGPVRALGDRALIVQALANLLDNAQLHTPRGTAIEIGVERIGAEVRVWISDDGPGVPAADRPLLTEPFFRTGRGRSVEGHGLGLSMVAAVCAAHHGRIVVTGREVGDGLRIELLLPAHAEPETTPPLIGGVGGSSKAEARGRAAVAWRSATAWSRASSSWKIRAPGIGIVIIDPDGSNM